jgi:indole-3-glycerol phosphate synthase
MGFLSEIALDARRDLGRAPLDESRLLARALALPPPRDVHAALLRRRVASGDAAPAVIAEVKRASPSAGPIADRDPGEQAASYEAGGASVVSVLTEPRHFSGSIADLRAARRRVSLPVLRKDFLVHPSQVIESRAEGADAVLLIAACLPGRELPAMLAVAADLGLACLVEAFSDEDLDRVLEAGAEIVGVNARDLETLEVDAPGALRRLRRVPDDRIAVLESGIAGRSDVRAALEAGASAVLVGEALMRAPDPAAKLRELLGIHDDPLPESGAAAGARRKPA